MGGKTKQSQRTKNNVRPSSSGRSALLLNNVKLESGVMNVAGTELPALFPSMVAPHMDPLLSPELQLCIKKLNKKDPITKTKALQELSELVVNSKVEDVVAALPSWAHFYRILTADPDRKVREATQLCHGRMMSACGRRVAPHLRQLVPAWLQAQYDEHAPALTHAHHSLHTTFPDGKLPEVISFCKSEVMAHLTDNLVGTGEAYVRKSDTGEERSHALDAAAVGALHGLQFVARHLPAAHHDWLWERAVPLLQHAAFWQRAHHADPRIRAAWYAAMGRIIERFGEQFLEQFGHKTLRVLVGCKESSPVAAAALWDAILLTMYTVQDWHKYLDKKELFNKRILDVLESGGWGDARHLSNMLLPLLAHLPPDLLTDHFYGAFFRAIFCGLEKKAILTSKSERQSWINGLDECLRYLSIQGEQYVVEVVTHVHRTWLESILSAAHEGQIKTGLVKHSAGRMAALVKYWLRQAGETRGDKYDQLVRNFWQNVGATLTAQIDRLSTDHAEIGKLIDGHVLLLHTLKTSFVQEAKKQQSIKFDGDSPTVVEKTEKEPACDAAVVDRYNHNLNDLVQKVCARYLEFAGSKQVSAPVLVPLISLLVEFDSSELFSMIARQCGAESAHRWYEAVLRGWLAGDSMRCKAVVDVVFLMLRHLELSEQDATLHSFAQFPPSVVEWCISLSLSHPHRLSPSVARWLRGPLVDESVIAICNRITEFGDSNAKNLLLMCLNLDANGEVMISDRAVSNILERMSAAVCDVTSPQLESIATMAAQLVTSVCSPAVPALVLALFRLSVLVPVGSDVVSVDTWREVRAAWQDGVQALPAAPRARLLAAAARVAHAALPVLSKLPDECPSLLPPPSQIAEDKFKDASLDIKQIEHVVSLCPYLLSVSGAGDVRDIVSFTRTILSVQPGDRRLVELFVLRHSIVRGDLHCPFPVTDLTELLAADCDTPVLEVDKDDVVLHLNYCVFRAVYLRTMLLHKLDEDLADTWCDHLLADDSFVRDFCAVLHDFMLVCAMFDAYGFWEHYPIVKDAKSKIENCLADILPECSAASVGRVSAALASHANKDGFYWAFAKTFFEVLSRVDRSKPMPESCPLVYAAAELKPDDPDGKDSSTHPEDTTKEEQPQEETPLEEREDSTRAEDNVELTKPQLYLEYLQETITGVGLVHTMQAEDRFLADVEPRRLRTAYVSMLRGVLAAHAREPRVTAALPGDVAAGLRAFDADVIVNAYYRHNTLMLQDQQVSSVGWSSVACNAAVMTYLCELVTARGWELPAHQWDFITITLCHALANKMDRWGSTKVSLYLRSALELYLAVSRFVSSVPAACVRRQPAPHVAALPREWDDIFAPDLHHSLFSLLVAVLESSLKTPMSASHNAVLDSLIKCTRLLEWDVLPAQHRAGRFSLDKLVRGAVRVLEEPVHYSYKYLAYELLQVLLKPLVLEDAEKLAAWSAEASEEDEARTPPHFSLLYYEPSYCRLRDIVLAGVAHVKVCEGTCSLVPFSDVHVVTLGWLLLAHVLHRHCTLARHDLHHHYIHTYREKKFCEPLLTTTLRLLPSEVVARAAAQSSTLPPLQRHVDMFTDMVPLHVYEYPTGECVSAAACRVLAVVAGGAGAGDARGWRGAAPHRHAALLDQLVTLYITPHIVKEHFAQVQKRADEVEDTEITIHWSSYEVVCVLTVEERPLELRVQLPRAFPLAPPRLLAAAHTPAANTNWLVMYLAYQNGSVLNALKMWVGAVNSKVERAAQCYICYCRLHYASGRLPGACCRQCRNKFHTACLRKWFATSNKSNCPLCRSSF